MSRRIKRILILCSVVLIVSWYIFDSTLLKRLVSLSLGELLSTSVFQTEIETASIHWLGIDATKVFFHGKSAFQSLLLDTMRLDCKQFETLTGQPHCSSTITLYGGSAAIDFYKKNERFFINGTLNDLKLNQHILIRGYGIEEGSLTVTDLSVTGDQIKLTDVNGNLEITGVKKPSSSRLPPSLTGLPIPIEIPAIDIDSLKASINYSNPVLTINDISLSSSLGDLQGSLQVKTNRLSAIDLRLALTEKGKEMLTPYLMFICPKDTLNKDTANPLIFEFKNNQIQCNAA